MKPFKCPGTTLKTSNPSTGEEYSWLSTSRIGLSHHTGTLELLVGQLRAPDVLGGM